MHIAFPFCIDGQGQVATTSETIHIEQMIEQVLFTIPGERVNRPTFGSGLQKLVFEPAQTELIAATQSMVQAALHQWLGDVIEVERIDIQPDETRVRVIVQYVIKLEQHSRLVQFTHEA